MCLDRSQPFSAIMWFCENNKTIHVRHHNGLVLACSTTVNSQGFPFSAFVPSTTLSVGLGTLCFTPVSSLFLYCSWSFTFLFARSRPMPLSPLSSTTGLLQYSHVITRFTPLRVHKATLPRFQPYPGWTHTDTHSFTHLHAFHSNRYPTFVTCTSLYSV